MRRFAFVVAGGFACLARIAAAQPAAIEWIGGLDPAQPNAYVTDISGDGSVLVGSSTTVGGDSHAFRWSAADGMEDLAITGSLPGISQAIAVSSDGSAVAGHCWSFPAEAFIWSPSGGTIQPPPLAGDSRFQVTCLSGDGSTVGGQSFGNVGRGVRWTSAGGTETLEVGSSSFAPAAISFDGSRIALNPTNSWPTAYIWRSTGSPIELTGPNGFGRSRVRSLTPSGNYAVGALAIDSTPRAANWNADGKIELYEAFGSHSDAYDVSANGRIVIGTLGGEACIWIDGVPTPLLRHLSDNGVDVSSLHSLSNSIRLSDNGRYMCGFDATFSNFLGFRITLPNNAPKVIAPQAISVECTGGQNLVDLLAIVDDVEGDALTVEWRVNGTLRKTENVAAGGSSSFEFDYPHGENAVEVTVSDADDSTISGTTVTVADTAAPSIVVAPNVKLNVDQAKLFASRSKLTPPEVTDLCDGDPLLTSDAPNRLPIGATTVVWTAIDEEGNVATASQKVTVVNRPPVANAGADVTRTVATKSVAVTLNGVRSSDPDKHKLTYRWTAPRVRFDDPKSPRPVGEFPVGTTTATLTVTDQAGAKSTDVVVVTVKAKATKKRSREELVLAHAAASVREGAKAARAAEGSRILLAVDLSRRAYSQSEKALAAARAGDEARTANLLRGSAVSNLSAAERYLKVYAATGDVAALAAARHAQCAAAYASN